MYNGATVGVVITAYNEEGFVGSVVESIPDYVDRVYVVDDGSTDGTWSEIQAVADQVNAAPREPVTTGTGALLHHRVVPIAMRENGGVGAAKKAAYRQVLDDGLDVVATMDGDGQMDPADLHRFLEPILAGHVGYTKGNRLWYPSSRAGMPGFRLFGNGVLSVLTKLSSGYFGMMDPQNGYTAISREALLDLPLDRMTDRYGFLNDQLAALNVNRVRIADVVHRARYGDEVSGIHLIDFVPRLSVLLANRFAWRLANRYVIFDFHPLVVYYLLGLFAMLAGGMLGLATLLSPAAGTSLTGLGVASIVTLLGAIAFTMGMVHDAEQNAGNVLHVPMSGLDDQGRAIDSVTTVPVTTAETAPPSGPAPGASADLGLAGEPGEAA